MTGGNHDTKVALERASRFLAKDQLNEATEICGAILLKAPGNARAHYLLGGIAQRSGRGRDAADHALTAARLRPDLPSLQLAAGALLYRAKAYGEALALYEAAIEKDPETARYHLGAASSLRKLGRHDEATAALVRAAAADPCDALVQYKLGQHLRSTGDFASAIEAYGRTLKLDPGHALAAFWLPATRKLSGAASQGNTEGSKHGLSREGVDGIGPPPPTAPREYVVGLYNSYAETFDSHLQGALAYRTPTVIVETLATLFPGRRWKRCLDLGCGTGLSGQAASAICDRLVGVDLSPAMVRLAREKRVYQRLLVGDVTDTVRRLCRESRSETVASREWDAPISKEEDGGAVNPSRDTDLDPPTEGAARDRPVSTANAVLGAVRNEQDLVLSCDVFVYIGDLRACFDAVRELMRSVSGDEDGAIFAFSAEASPPIPPTAAERESAEEDNEGGSSPSCSGLGLTGYELAGTGRYTHSRDYLETVCRDAGFRVAVMNDVVLRKNAGEPVHGFVVIAEAIATSPVSGDR